MDAAPRVRPAIRVLAMMALVVAAALAAYAFAPTSGARSRAATIPVSQPGATRFPGLSSDRPTALKVLFIGNSFTFYGVPEAFGRLVQAAEPERGTKVEMVAFPNARLDDHARLGSAARAIAEDGPWDFVVLQDQSRIAFDDREGMRRGVTALDERVRAAHAKTVLYETWVDSRESERQQVVIDTAYEFLGLELGARLAPVGVAWLSAGPLRPKLYGPDGHHPSALGVYLTACVLYATVTGKSPEGLPFKTVAAADPIQPEDALALQRIAATIVPPDVKSAPGDR